MEDPTVEVAVRRVRASEWRQARALRLESLRDAPRVFLEPYQAAIARPESYWRETTTRRATTDTEAQFVAIAGGIWVGKTVVRLREFGPDDYRGPTQGPVAEVFGVYVAPSHRGSGTIDRLLASAVDWARCRGPADLSLEVSTWNERAQGAYRRAGFEATGRAQDGPAGPELEMRRPTGSPGQV